MKDERESKREQMIALNQSKRITNAENLLEDLIEDGAELLALERYSSCAPPLSLWSTRSDHKLSLKQFMAPSG